MIPTFDKFIHPVLQCIADKKEHNLDDIRNKMITYFSLTQEDLMEKVKGGGQTKFNNRIQWATTYLKKAELLQRPRRGVNLITHKGLEILKSGEIITPAFLRQYSLKFREFSHGNTIVDKNIPHVSLESPENIDNETPIEAITRNMKLINQDLADDLLQLIRSQSARFFEQLVLDLLVKMGYGGQFENSAIVTQYSNDEGIDGVIKEDKLGLEKIFIQAKRYNDKNIVGREEIQKFVGALAGQGANKGVFITTSTFTKHAREYKPQGAKIVLIDGPELCHYMIEYQLGVYTKQVFKIKKIDSDYFNID